MDTEFCEIFENVSPRENAGSSSSNAFSYQQHWALCHLLELHKSDGDYILLLDYHDDVLVIHDLSESTLMDFFQVKTKKSGNFVESKLTTIPKNGASIFSKMCHNYSLFPKHTRSINLISNQHYSLQCPKGKTLGLDEFELDQLSETQINKLFTKSEVNLTDKEKEALRSLTFFKVSPLSLEDHVDHAEGKMNSFLRDLFGPVSMPLSAFFRTVTAELKRLNDSVTHSNDFEQIVKQKGLKRADFQKMLNSVPHQDEVREAAKSLLSRLTQEGISYSREKMFRHGLKTFMLHKSDPLNEVLARLAVVVNNELKFLEESKDLTLEQRIESVFREVTKNFNESYLLDADEIYGAILYEEARQNSW